MIPIRFLFALPLVTGQLSPMSVEPDVAFGDQNDRFDITGMLEGQQKYFDTHGMSANRRNWQRPRVPSRRRQSNNPLLYEYRRDDDWVNDMQEFSENRNQAEQLNNGDMYARAQEYRRHPHSHPSHVEQVAVSNSPHGKTEYKAKEVHRRAPSPSTTAAPLKEREILLHYNLPIKVKVIDTPSGLTIKAIHIM